MATIVTRSGKGSPLTNTEVDSNFSNLNTDKLEDAPSDGNQYARQSGAWAAFSSAASVVTSSTAPSSPSDGDIWYSESNGVTYVYYADGSSSQWVATGAPTGSLGGSEALSGLSDVNITSPQTNDLLAYDSGTSKWVNDPILIAQWDSSSQVFSSSASYIITGTWSSSVAINTPVSQSSGVFTFASTGIWQIRAAVTFSSTGGTNTAQLQIETTTDGGSNWTAVGSNARHTGNSFYSGHNITAVAFFDVTSTANCKVRFRGLASSTNSTDTLVAHPIFHRVGAT